MLLVTNLFPTPADPARGPLGRLRSLALVPREYRAGGLQVYAPKYLMLPRVCGRCTRC